LREIYLTPGGVFDSDKLKEIASDLEAKSADPDFWNDHEQAEKVLSQLNHIKSRYEPWEQLIQELQDCMELLSLALEEGDESLEKEISHAMDSLEKTFDKLNTLELLSCETDPLGAFVTIHSGAGGTEACDWAAMLYRMYSRWVERKGFKMILLDSQEAEGGIKSVSLQINGDFAHGLLKGEGGIHRLVRISPF
jgi:peptide chain release factor 2